MRDDGDGKPAIPESMTTFADMITLMLTFFILLCTFASAQNSEYFASGVGSFRRAVENLGLPGIMQSNSAPVSLGAQQKTAQKSRNAGHEEFWSEVETRLIEENPEALRDALLQSLRTEQAVLIPAGIRFSSGSTELSPEAKDRLDRAVRSFAELNLRVEIIAFGDPGVDSLGENLVRAILRARAVGDYLIETNGIPARKITYSGLKPPTGEPRMKGQREEVLFRLKPS